MRRGNKFKSFNSIQNFRLALTTMKQQMVDVMSRSEWRVFVSKQPRVIETGTGFAMEGLKFEFTPPSPFKTPAQHWGTVVIRDGQGEQPQFVRVGATRRRVHVESWGRAPFAMNSSGIVIPNGFKCKCYIAGITFVAETKVEVSNTRGDAFVQYRMSSSENNKVPPWGRSPSNAILLMLWEVIESTFIRIIGDDHGRKALYSKLGRLIKVYALDKTSGKVHIPIGDPAIQAQINAIFTPVGSMQALVDAIQDAN